MKFRSHHQTLITFLLKIREREWDMWKKIPGWHGGESRGESGDVLGRSGECPNLNPQGEGLFLRESKKERGMKVSCGLGKRKESWWLISPRPGTHLRATCVDCPRCPCGRSARCADGPLFPPERPVPPLLPTNHADGPRRPGGGSARNGRTVRPTAADSPTSLFISLIYSEIRIWICIFWDHCSWIMKETCHMMQCSYHARKLCEKQAS
jgi:hypothetical protein